MRKHKRLVIGGVVLLIVAVAGMLFYRNLHKLPPGVIDGGKQAEQPLLVDTPSVNTKNFIDLRAKVDAKNWSEVIVLAQAYGDDTGNITATRIGSYGFCIQAATNLKVDSVAAGCRTKGEALITTLPEADRILVIKLFEANASGKDYVDDAASGGTEHE
jgi:hypothetical protein